MGRRKKVDTSAPGLSMASIASEESFEGNDANEEETDLEAMAGEEAESLEADAETEAEAKPAPKPRKRRSPRKKPEPAVEVAAAEPTLPEATPAAAGATPTAPVIPTAPAPQFAPIAAIDSVPLALTETAISSRVLNQMTRQIDAEAAAQDPNQLVKQLSAVKEISVSICSQLDRMTATLIELQNKHATAIQDLQKEKAAPRKAKIPTWLAATSAIALTLSIVSMSLTQATRHSLMSQPNAGVPSHLLTGMTKPAFANESTPSEAKASSLPGSRTNSKPAPAIARKESGASRRGKR